MLQLLNSKPKILLNALQLRYLCFITTKLLLLVLQDVCLGDKDRPAL
jgi:hypothetical protein